MKKFITWVVVGVLWAGVAWGSCEGMVAWGMPKVKSYGEMGVVLCRRMYVLEHNDERHTAWWSAERLVGAEQGIKRTRINAFKADPDLSKTAGADPSDYLNTGYDKGHLAPAGDMHVDPEAMLESFYLSNMVPQIPKNNRVGWRFLETYARRQAKAKGVVFVITGPIYQGDKVKTIGASKVAVPSHLYKIIYDPVTNEALSFVVPNVPIKWPELIHFISDVAAVEQLTGISFFPQAVTPVKDIHQMW